MLYGIDIGTAAKNPDWNLLKQKGIGFVVIKATQGNYRVNPRFPALLAAARREGLLAGLYHWCDPLCNGSSQAAYFLEKTASLDYDFAALDFEQYWADWKEWPANIRTILPPQQISAVGCQTALSIRAGLCSHTPGQLLVYTRASFIRDFAPSAAEWLAAYPLWIAHWACPAGRVELTWEELFAQDCGQALQPALPRGITRWVLHQWSGDRFILPGLGGDKADLNRFAGSLAEFRAWLGLPALDRPEDPPLPDECLPILKERIEQFRLASAGLCDALIAFTGSHSNENTENQNQPS